MSTYSTIAASETARRNAIALQSEAPRISSFSPKTHAELLGPPEGLGFGPPPCVSPFEQSSLGTPLGGDFALKRLQKYYFFLKVPNKNDKKRIFICVYAFFFVILWAILK